MPSRPRRETVLEGEVGVYHCWSRCVRRAFLCGQDPYSGKDYEYRRDWIRQFQERLAGLFGIEIGFHAEMSNHIHLILRTRPDVVGNWSDEEVARRWLTVTHLVRSKDGQSIKPLSDLRIAMETSDPHRVEILRKRLASVSYFMAALCENVARRSNFEDHTKGSFWEDRFKCRDLADEAAILVCGIYIDLNQVRAGEALTPELSTHTSAYDRIAGRQQRLDAATKGLKSPTAHTTVDGWLCELTLAQGQTDAGISAGVGSVTSRRASDKGLLPITLEEYLHVLDASGRMLCDGKSGFVPDHMAPILERLGVNTDVWSELITKFDEWFGHVVGRTEQLVDRASRAGRRWYWGRARCAEAFG